MILTLYTESFFNAAHRLNDYDGKCARLHGHAWKIGVWIRGSEADLGSNGILWDFSNIKKITDEFDHTVLNDVMKENPTAENITLFMYKRLKSDYPHLSFKVRVYEGTIPRKSYCETGDF